ncbi:MAG: GyrI-like domain-containing protein, partial [Firmicutes bacterium]|nr:GyrI-like domain-containing protein [Bacillota bacterium]
SLVITPFYETEFNVSGGLKYIKNHDECVFFYNDCIFALTNNIQKIPVLIKRGIKAKDYFEYYKEVDCGIWGKLLSIKGISEEPVSMWLPKKYIKPETSEYVQGVEVGVDYKGELPDGFDIIELPASKYLMFCGEPFKEEDYCEAIEAVWGAIEKYNPKVLGYEYDENSPRIQLEPRGERGYIELVPVKSV